MNRLISGLVAAAMVAGVLGGCAPVVTPRPSPTPTVTTDPVPTLTVTPTTSTPLPPPASQPVALKVYFAYQEKMQPAARTAPAGTKAVLKAALDALLAGPTSSERAGGLVTMVPKGTKLRGVTISANVAIVDFDSTFASGGGSLSMFDRLAQVVYTATQFPGVDAVTFKLDGKKVTVFGGEGIIIDKPRTRKACEGETPAILVDTPAWRGTLKAGDVVRGTANVFEGTFKIEVRDSADTLVSSKTVQATSGTGTRGTWSVAPALTGAKAGIGSIRVYAESPKDGSPVDVVKVPVILEP
ncbi:MAG TPA: GerMN domain-containing protein [Coriobacteriia bacterium]